MSWINKDTEIYCSFAKQAGNTGCRLMNSAFYYYNLNKIYKSFSVDSIKDAVSAARILDFKGFAITMPFKKHVLDFVDELDSSVESIGAANTVLNIKGKLKAYNTDYLAAKEYLSYYNSISTEWKYFYILGNGGYALAVKTAAEELGMKPIFITRSTWDEVKSLKNSIVYNCTPVENIKVDSSNIFIDCLVTTLTGIKLATLQASYQFNMYTGLKFPY